MVRLDHKDTRARAGHELRWGEVRGYLVNPSLPAGITFLAVKMRATDNLSMRSSRLINCLVTRKLPVWNPSTGWSSPQATRSIAWALADAVRASYGAKLADRRIDLLALYRLDQIWNQRGDQFDAVFDQKVTVWEALSFAYNVGSRAFCQSTLVKKLNSQDYPGACQELLRWRFFQGKDCALPTNARLCGGLATRREAEYRLCMGEVAP